ncbi:MAG: alkane 1-monooxygenase, partial [Brevibacterium aurantiacum]|nr:alkane 1-monooxygenase [Brevibacterium aurantiacum]
ARVGTTGKQRFAASGRGRRRHLQPPVDPSELAGGGESPMLRISAVGSPETATRQLSEFVERTGADELITVTYAYEPAAAERSLKLLADAWF